MNIKTIILSLISILSITACNRKDIKSNNSTDIASENITISNSEKNEEITTELSTNSTYSQEEISTSSNEEIITSQESDITISSSSEEDVSYDDENYDYVAIAEGNHIDVQVGKSLSLTTTCKPEDLTSRMDTWLWTSSDENIATVSKYGVVTGVKEGKCIITFNMTIDDGKEYKATTTLNVIPKNSSISYRYERVDDLDSLKGGDIIVFACPQKNITANINRLQGALEFSTTSFSSDYSYITSLGEDSAEFILDEKELDGETVFTLESQENKYLAAKNFKNITFVNSTGNILWGFETIDNKSYVYSTNATIDGYLMFNTKADKFTLYDSNEQIDMFLPTVYKLNAIY